eukprot:TRINITY_DN12942_c0_g1_i1.p2 TRINITY_DN12942_c0_g1~~TRINITY_DN12942_c0_g1_i1.p2  ORF type:complete len:258 (-),score=63.49 TRINITY_DN12942_c0_g1_i1:806-1579(-)
MSSIGAGYDLSCSTYSPQGRIFQVEYADKAVENSGTSIGIRCKNGVVFAVEKIVQSQMLEKSSNCRLFTVDKHIGMASSGMWSDSRQIVNRSMSEAKQYRDFYDDDIPIRMLNERISSFYQVYTLYSFVRPFGCAMIFGGVDRKGPQLYKVGPSGVSYGYYACAAGKAERAAKSLLEQLDLSEMDAEDAVIEAAKIIYKINDEEKDKDFVLELSWSAPQTNNLHKRVTGELYERAVAAAVQARDESDSDSDMDDESY